jgi:hypothetical protein
MEKFRPGGRPNEKEQIRVMSLEQGERPGKGMN